MAERVGFIGLGIMGRPMAHHLVGKVDLAVFDLAAQPRDELVAAGATALTPTEMAAQCDVLCTMLPTGAIVLDVLSGLHDQLRPGMVVVDFSSVTPAESRACAELLATRDVGFVDAPVSGGEPKAIDGTLAIMCGGSEADIARVEPVLRHVASTVTRVGDVGAGSVVKLANQIIVNLTIAAVGEAMVFARKAGVDVATVHEAIRGGLAGSTVLDAKAPMMAEHTFAPGGTLAINRKDIGNVLATAREMQIPTPMSAQLYEAMQTLACRGRLGLDHSALVTYFEDLADVSVAAGSAEG